MPFFKEISRDSYPMNFVGSRAKMGVLGQISKYSQKKIPSHISEAF
jgi:hypothetical protein